MDQRKLDHILERILLGQQLLQDQHKAEPILERIQLIQIVPFGQQLLQHHLMLLHIHQRVSVECNCAISSLLTHCSFDIHLLEP